MVATLAEASAHTGMQQPPRGTSTPIPPPNFHMEPVYKSNIFQQAATKTVFHSQAATKTVLHSHFQSSPTRMFHFTVTLGLVLCTLLPALSVPLSRSTREAHMPTPNQRLWCELQRNLTVRAELGSILHTSLTNASELVDATCNLTAAYSLLHINGDNTSSLAQDLKAYLSELCQEVSMCQLRSHTHYLLHHCTCCHTC